MATKKEMFTKILAVAQEGGFSDIEEFVTKELALLEKRSASSEAAKLRAEEEREELGEQIVGVLTNATAPMRTMEIATAIGISPQKATPVLKALVDNGAIKVEMTSKKVKVYTAG